MTQNIIEVKNLDVYYGESQILRDINLEIEKGSITAIMGRNGVGKTTLLKAICGLLDFKKGKMLIEGKDYTNVSADLRVKAGIGYVPQGREIFSKLTVYENLLIGLEARTDGLKKVPTELVYDLFPVLGDMEKRMGGNLSGGQQQQLAIARALVGDPKVLILDEPTEGIQPSIIQDIEKALVKLKDMGNLTIILVEQYFDFARQIGNFFYMIDRGQIGLSGKAENLSDESIKKFLTF